MKKYRQSREAGTSQAPETERPIGVATDVPSQACSLTCRFVTCCNAKSARLYDTTAPGGADVAMRCLPYVAQRD